MALEIVHGTPHLVWMPVYPAATVYVGGIASQEIGDPGEGVIMIPDAAGVANDTNKDIPLGIIVGTNASAEGAVYDTTYNTESFTAPAAADAHGGATATYLGTGNKVIGDPIPMVKVALLTSEMVVRAPLRNAAIGTAPTLLTATNTSSDGLGITTNAADFTGVADNMQTIYCRSGANAGVYRVTDSASSTVHTWDKAMRNDIAIGDTFVMVPAKGWGLATIMFDATSSTFVDVADAPDVAGTTRWAVTCIRLNLEVAGQEYVDFMFQPPHFSNFATTA